MSPSWWVVVGLSAVNVYNNYLYQIALYDHIIYSEDYITNWQIDSTKVSWYPVEVSPWENCAFSARQTKTRYWFSAYIEEISNEHPWCSSQTREFKNVSKRVYIYFWHKRVFALPRLFSETCDEGKSLTSVGSNKELFGDLPKFSDKVVARRLCVCLKHPELSHQSCGTLPTEIEVKNDH